MADDRGIRAAVREKTGWSPQNLSQRVTRLTEKRLMSRTHALYVLAHQAKIKLEKFGVDDATLIQVGELSATHTGAEQLAGVHVPESARSATSSDSGSTAASRFNSRGLHSHVVSSSRKAFTSGLHQEAVHKAFQRINNRVKKLACTSLDGSKLMGWAFNDSPHLQMTSLSTESEQNEHAGLRFLMQGAMLGIRNPRAHEDHWVPDEDEAAVLELLSLASYLHRCLDRCEKFAAGEL